MVLQEKTTNIVIAGAGGQGNLFVSRVLGQAAMDKGLQVKIAETYGVAQRGGSVHSQVRFGAAVFGPLIPHHRADIILGLEPLETLRLALDYIGPSTVIVTNTHAVIPVHGDMDTLPYPAIGTVEKYFQEMRVQDYFLLDAYSIANDLGNAQALNMIMAGALIGTHAMPLSLDEIKEAVGLLSSGEAQRKNLAALDKGFDCTHSRKAALGSTVASRK